jgi:heme-degrading monooxygenase HmoA
MYALMVTFQLDGMSTDAFEASYTEAAPAFADMPDLIEKVWLHQPEANTFGGVYLWQSQTAAEDYLNSGMFQQHIRNNSQITNLRIEAYNVLDNPTRITRELSGATAIAESTRPARPSQAEGDPETVAATIAEKEARGEM